MKKETIKRLLDVTIIFLMVAIILTALGILTLKGIRNIKKPSYHIETMQDSYGVYTILTDNKGNTLHVRYDRYFKVEEPSDDEIEVEPREEFKEGVENESE